MIQKIITVILFSVFLFNLNTHAQCGNELKREAYEKIKGGTYLKDFRIRFEESSKKNPDSEEFTIMLYKGVRYRFVLKNDKTKEGEAVIKLYDDFKIYASSYDGASATHHNVFEFFCQKTQAYYVSGHFLDGKKGCAIIMLGNMGKY
ncbi:MAG: hypothetical protein C0599_18555 [Salinivirgaceae bacterium]|nr:MAG: hypothetical protein C0599_18555 [Salinivirgaceae bacterium]